MARYWSVPAHLAVLILCALVFSTYAAAQSAPAAPTAITPAQAAPFAGDWTLNLQGQRGDVEFAVSVKTENGKVLAEVSSDQQPKQTVTDVSRSGDTMTLRYSFDYQGTPVPVVATLTLDGEKLKASFDFAGGAYGRPERERERSQRSSLRVPAPTAPPTAPAIAAGMIMKNGSVYASSRPPLSAIARTVA